MDQNNNPKSAYEERKKEKEEERARGEKSLGQKTAASKFIKIFVWLVVLAAIGYGIFIFINRNIPKGEDKSVEFPVMGAEHIPTGSIPQISYNSNPPTSGPHYPEPARPGFREEAIADQHLLHSMEHGLVWLSYHPRIGDEKNKLKKVTNGFTVTTSREANDADIAVAAWGRLDKFNLEDGTLDADDLQRVRDFINRYANKGPERIPAGQHGGI